MPYAAPTITDVLDNIGGVQGSVLNNGMTDDRRPTITGDAVADALVELRNGGATLAGVTANSSGQWTYTPPSDLALAGYSIEAYQFDSGGVISPPSTPRVFTVVEDQVMTGAAQWLSEKVFSMSSLDIGLIGVVEPWGSVEFGHSYTFALGSGAPSGVTIEEDAGSITNTSALAVGDHTFPVEVTNLKDTGKVSTFYITVRVRQGVTSGRTGTQVLHKDYVVSSGTYGTPVGQDYSAVMMAIRTQIETDQAANGEDNIRPTVVFNAGQNYDYENNRWTYGMRNWRMRTTVPGTRANLRCISSSSFSIAVCTLQVGRGWANDNGATGSYIGDAGKDNAYFINTVAAESTSVTLKTAGDAANFYVGRWVAVVSYDQQGGGFPPNCRFVDYARIVSISGATVNLDRKLRWEHRDDHWESSDANSVGKARLIDLERPDLRLTLKVHMQDINFELNPNTTSTAETFFYDSALEGYFKNCAFWRFCTYQVRHAILDGCTTGASELDKLSTRFIMLGGSSRRQGGTGIYMATGLELVLLKNVDGVSGRLEPMQYRIIGGSMIGETDRCILCGGWASWQTIARSVDFTDIAGPVVQHWTPDPITVGTGGITYSSGVLTVPTGATNWDVPMKVAREGGLVYVGSVLSGRNGYITAIRGNSGSTAHLYSITWLNGSPPANGDQLVFPRLHELEIDNACTVSGGVSFQSAAHTVRQVSPGMTTRDFPAGYPASAYKF